MDQPQLNLLSRDEIIAILNQRHLKIPNIDSLSYLELSRIYKMFVVPLEKREPKRVSDAQPLPPPTVSPVKRPLVEVVMTPALPARPTYHVPATSLLLQQAKHLKLSLANSIGNKRRNPIAMYYAQEATRPKRQPVPWLK